MREDQGPAGGPRNLVEKMVLGTRGRSPVVLHAPEAKGAGAQESQQEVLCNGFHESSLSRVVGAEATALGKGKG